MRGGVKFVKCFVFCDLIVLRALFGHVEAVFFSVYGPYENRAEQHFSLFSGGFWERGGPPLPAPD